jgi:hypothetical protein
VLLGSSGIPGFFPPAHIPVTVDGVRYVERHVDGGASAALFYRPPEIPTEIRGQFRDRALYDSDVYAIVAGKLFADPTPIKPRALSIAANSVSDIIYAQTRGDLSRLFLISMLTGLNFHMTAIPQDFPAPKSSTDFDPVKMQAMFDEGVRQVRNGTVWRRTPPGVEPGELPLERYGTTLTQVKRGSSGPVMPAAAPAMIPSADGIPIASPPAK